MIDWLRREMQEPSITLAAPHGEVELPVVLRRHSRAKRMTMRMAPDGSEIRITLPNWGRTAEALEFARSRREWLEAQLAKLVQAASSVPEGQLMYRGEAVDITWQEKAPRLPMLIDGAVQLGGQQASVESRLRRWLESEALALMGHDLDHYCSASGNDRPALRLSRAKQRWGSCSGDGTIRLNWRLVQAPDFVRRSVVAHEVAHLTHFDHSRDFHALLGRIYEGDIKVANSWLKQQGRSLYARFG